MRYLISFFLMVFSGTAGAQVEMAEGLRSSGKIYVVVGVITIIFIGLAIYLVTIDKKVSKIERANH